MSIHPWKPTPKRFDRGLWWDRAWSLVDGCTPVSEACENCWAARMAVMRSHQTNEAISGPVKDLVTSRGWNGSVRAVPSRLALPASTRAPTTWSIWNDLFHPDVPSDFVSEALTAMRECVRHAFMVLTKRAGGMELRLIGEDPERFRHVRFGVTVENKAALEARLSHLARIGRDGFRTFLSLEPVLGDLGLRPEHLRYVDFVIAGGESGPRARPSHPEWFRNIRDACRKSETSFLFKQWGEYLPTKEGGDVDDEWDNPDIPLLADGFDCRGAEAVIHKDLRPALMARVGKRAAGRRLDRVEYLEWPERWRG